MQDLTVAGEEQPRAFVGAVGHPLPAGQGEDVLGAPAHAVVAGLRAAVTIDSVPGVELRGRVDSWSPATGSRFSLLPPDNATGNFTKVVQRIPVKIVLDHDSSALALLRPGMSVIATVDTSGASEHHQSAADASQ